MAALTYQCPDDRRWRDDIVGCGHTFEAEPDREGLIDCPNCGMWFVAAMPVQPPTWTVVLSCDEDDLNRALNEIGCEAEIHPGRLIGGE